MEIEIFLLEKITDISNEIKIYTKYVPVNIAEFKIKNFMHLQA